MYSNIHFDDDDSTVVPEVRFEILAEYGAVQFIRINGGSLAPYHGYYKVVHPEGVIIKTRDPHLAWSNFVVHAVCEFTLVNFDMFGVFPNDEVPKELGGKREVGPCIVVPEGNIGTEFLKKFRNLLMTYVKKL